MFRSTATGLASITRRLSPWTLLILSVAVVVALPVIVVLAHIVMPTEGVWQHLASTVLGRYVSNTLYLTVTVGLGTMIIGTGPAWLVVMCRFPGRRIFEWALLLPLAVPTYVIAYAYTDFLQYAGPLQTWLREVFEWGRGDYYFPNIRSLGGAATLITLVLYP
ncbi:MAG: ABC transporter permease, partial [Billgrantia desiderata]